MLDRNQDNRRPLFELGQPDSAEQKLEIKIESKEDLVVLDISKLTASLSARQDKRKRNASLGWILTGFGIIASALTSNSETAAFPISLALTVGCAAFSIASLCNRPTLTNICDYSTQNQLSNVSKNISSLKVDVDETKFATLNASDDISTNITKLTRLRQLVQDESKRIPAVYEQLAAYGLYSEKVKVGPASIIIDYAFPEDDKKLTKK